MRCTYVLHRWHCAVSSALLFSCEFSTNRFLTGKRSHLAKATSIFCNYSGQFSSRCFANIYSYCSLSFPWCPSWPSTPRDVHNQRCRKLLFSDLFHGLCAVPDVSKGMCFMGHLQLLLLGLDFGCEHCNSM